MGSMDNDVEQGWNDADEWVRGKLVCGLYRHNKFKCRVYSGKQQSST